MNICSHVMRDGKVCEKRCFREKCHSHTEDRMKRDCFNHKKLRVLKKSVGYGSSDPAHRDAMHLVSTTRDAQDQKSATPYIFSSPVVREKSQVVRDQSLASHASHASRTKRDIIKEEAHASTTSHASHTKRDPIQLFETWIERVSNNILNSGAVQPPYKSLSEMEKTLLGPLRKALAFVNEKKISKTEFLKIAQEEAKKLEEFMNL